VVSNHVTASTDGIIPGTVIPQAIAVLGHVGGLLFRSREETAAAGAAEDVERLVGGMARVSEDQSGRDCDC
jgi:hypothetical protein